MADLTDVVREAVKADIPEAELVLDGFLVIETLEVGQADPVLQYRIIGDPTTWKLAGMARAYSRAVDRALDAGHQDEDDE